MLHKIKTSLVSAALVFVLIAGVLPLNAQQQTLRRTAQAWTLDEAMAQLYANPHDAYLQYVALQLARRENKFDQTLGRIISFSFRDSRFVGRRNDAELFNLFSGALAVQESLQLDTLVGDGRMQLGVDEVSGSGATPQSIEADRIAREKRNREQIPISSLYGPGVQSHPWNKMLAGRKPEISSLAKTVPEDFYFAEFASLTKLLDAAEVSDLWGTHLFNQASQEAQTHAVGDRIKKQLALETHPELRPFYDSVVQRVAISGSDLYMREGSDVTLLFQLKTPAVFKLSMDTFLANAEKANADAKRTTGEYLGVPYVQLSTPDNHVSVLSAYPTPDLHVRSNSPAAFRHIIEAIKGKTPDGKTVRRLGETDEFAYIRTLMLQGAKEEDGLIYLSDPFIHRVVSSRTKLGEQRRLFCYNHLRMISHAALMYRTEFGQAPPSLQALANTKTAPGVFGRGELVCPHGGTYTLSADGLSGHCSVHGDVDLLTPNIDIPLDTVTGREAEGYTAFVKDYNQYWRIYFDPIVMRIQVTPEQYRLETIVLPLIDNSIYTGLAKTLGGKPEPLDALPVPSRNIFSVAAHIDKAELVKQITPYEPYTPNKKSTDPFATIAESLGVKPEQFKEFFNKGIGSQIGFNVYDSPQTFDLNMASLMGQMLGSFNGRSNLTDPIELYVGILLAALNSPVYLSIPVQDKKIVDDFLGHLDPAMVMQSRSRYNFLDLGSEFYHLQQDGQGIRTYALVFGPIKLRFFWARIGDGLYIASKPFILEDLIANDARMKNGSDSASTAPTTKSMDDAASMANGLLKVRPQNWNAVLADYRLGWEENSRASCAKNAALISGIARALTAGRDIPSPENDRKEITSEELISSEIGRQTERLYGVHLFCPDGGHYQLSADRKSVACSIHGSAISPKQPSAPNENSDLGKLLKSFGGLTAGLTFMDDGLHAVVTIDRR